MLAALENRELVSCHRKNTSNPGIPFVAAIFPIAALAAVQPGEAAHELDARDVFRHLVAELTLEPEAQRRAMGDVELLAVHLIGEDRLRMGGVGKVDALVIADRFWIIAQAAVIQGIGAVEDDIVRLRLDAGARQDFGERHAPPFADAAPALDAVMARDLRARGKRAQIVERERKLPIDKAVDL